MITKPKHLNKYQDKINVVLAVIAVICVAVTLLR